MGRSSSGFSLIEVAVVVAIVGILTAIAYPSYVDFVLRGNRAEGREFLLRVAAAQERFYTNLNQYTADVAGNAGLGLGVTQSENGYYAVQVALADAGQSYILTATPQNRQAADQCGNLTINNVGSKGYSGSDSNGRCW